MGAFILIAQKDSKQATAIGDILPVAVLRIENDHPVVYLQERRLAPEKVYLGGIGPVALSSQGARLLEAGCRDLYAAFGVDAPKTIDLSSVSNQEIREKLLLALVGRLAEFRKVQAARNVMLMREAAQLRQFQFKTQDAFARLEQFVYDQQLGHRSDAKTLLPMAGSVALSLPPGSVLEQRLPRSSAGLSDVAVFLSTGEKAKLAENGVLTVELATVEDGKIHAVWAVPAAELKPGWLRLTLPVSLDADEMIPLIRLSWEGKEALCLDRAMQHPDQRFQAIVDGEPSGSVLALRTWNYVAGSAAPIPQDGHLPGKRIEQSHRVLSSEELATAINLQSVNKYCQLLAQEAAYQVHVMTEGESVVVIPAVAGEGTIQISSGIRSRSDKSPYIEYAIALAPVKCRPKPDTELPVFAAGFFSGWSLLPPLVDSVLHLVLPTPISELHDLYLMTRLPKGKHDISYGWSSFFNIQLETEAGGASHG